MAEDASVLPTSVRKLLSHKLYKKRKKAALEIETMVRQLCSDGDHERIDYIIDLLVVDFMYSPQTNNRQGGLLGLAAVIVGLSTKASQHLWRIVPSVLNSFDDQDCRVRYYACEALYNIVKIVRGDSIAHFREIFHALCKLVVDSDTNVQRVAHILDALVKDIVTESDKFSVEEFIELLQVHMKIISPYVRQFLVGWITVLYNVPDIDLLSFLPDFLDGLINLLSDEKGETRHIADVTLSAFLIEIRNSSNVDYKRMTEILVQRAKSPDGYTRLIAITWINEFVKLGNQLLIPYYADIIGAILPCISDEEEKIRVLAFETNEELRALCSYPSEGFIISSILFIAKRQLSSNWEATRIEALRWMTMILSRHRSEVIAHSEAIFDCLLSALLDISDKIVLQVLEVLACIARDAPHFHQLVVYLLDNFRNNKELLGNRGSLIVCHLCVHLDAERVYREFAIILKEEVDHEFASTMVQALNLILLTSSELKQLRSLLKKAIVDSAGKQLFICLYACWSHSPTATISLCFLTQAYYLVSNVIESLEDDEIDTGFLMQLNKLIRLLETPKFAYLRLQLLEPARHHWLLKSLYGLLMLLPQRSSAFMILRTRLKLLPSSNLEHVLCSQCSRCSLTTEDTNKNQDAEDMHGGIDSRSKLQQFQQMQDQHHTHAKTQSQSQLSTATTSSQEKQNARTRRIFSAFTRTGKQSSTI